MDGMKEKVQKDRVGRIQRVANGRKLEENVKDEGFDRGSRAWRQKVGVGK